jgi:hypothetical protein
MMLALLMSEVRVCAIQGEITMAEIQMIEPSTALQSR